MARRLARARLPPEFRLETLETRVLFSADTPFSALAPGVPEAAQLVASVSGVDGTEVYASEAALSPRELVIIDAGVPDLDVLLTGLTRHGEAGPHVVVLEAGEDALGRLGEILAGQTGLSAVHLISHGAEGTLELGGERVTTLDLLAHAEQIAGWRDAFADGADMLLYGCDVAATAEGRSFVDTLARLTGTDVAASTDTTGALARGGDWQLEYARGEVGREMPLSAALRANYDATLDIYTVMNYNNDGSGSLREAINLANSNGAADTILFDRVGTIELTTELPAIESEIVINALTHADNSGKPGVVLDGDLGPTSGMDGLILANGSAGSAIRGLMIVDFSADGIVLFDTNDIEIESNYIGTDGVNALGNDIGIYVEESFNFRIGGTNGGGTNVISGNDYTGVYLSTEATGGTVQSNYIGTDAIADAAVANGFGVLLGDGARDNTIGGVGSGNVISGNVEGIRLSDASNNDIQGNYIGTDKDGLKSIANTGGGVHVENGSANNRIGGAGFVGSAGAKGNLISGNGGSGVSILGADTDGNVVQGNLIGLTLSGDVALGNTRGIVVEGGASDTLIGGDASAEEHNIVAGSFGGDGVRVSGSGTDGTRLLGNHIGLNKLGDGTLSNGESGVRIDGGASNTTIGGTYANARNVISANFFHGVHVTGAGTADTLLQGNYIGLDASGTRNFGNLRDGVMIAGGATATIIGGTTAASANVIRANGAAGIAVADTTSTGNAFLGNSIAVNTGLGIDLGTTGTDANDPGDADAGANDLQNSPTLSRAGTDRVGSIEIAGTVDSTPNTDFRVEFFGSGSADPSGRGEADRYLGFALVSTDISGVASFDDSMSATLADGEFVSATSTALDDGGKPGSTSEFSANVVAQEINQAPNFHAAGMSAFTSHDIAIDAYGAVSVTTADVNSDGELDVLSASFLDDWITWYENDGGESFTIHPIDTDANFPRSVTTADVNGDGKLDVLSASELGDRIVWYENDGSESFTAHDIATDADSALSVTTADVDGDGDVDVLSASFDDDRVVWYENDGSGNFTAHDIATDANGAASVTTADVDGDGDVDVLSASELDDRIVWYENDGSENFTAHDIATDADGAVFVVTADVDGDGDVDVLSASTRDDRIVWYENDDSENFTAHDIATDAEGARSVTTADVDGDGDVDVLSASEQDDRIVWYENDGSESFTTHDIAADADEAHSVTTADVDGDGDVDVLSASVGDHRIVWYENNPSTLDANPTFVEGGPAVVLDADVDVSDVELDALEGGNGNYAGAEVSLMRTGAANAEDVFGFVDGNGLTLVGGNLIKNSQIVAVFDTGSTAGELVVRFTDAGGEIPTTADVENVVQQITYANASVSPPASVQLEWLLDDGNSGAQGVGGPQTATSGTRVTITQINDTPVITSAASALVAENTTAVLTVTSTDPDTGDSATYSIAGWADAALFSINPHQRRAELRRRSRLRGPC